MPELTAAQHRTMFAKFVAAVNRINVQGNAEAQAEQIRTVMARVFPEAVALVREAREGLQ